MTATTATTLLTRAQVTAQIANTPKVSPQITWSDAGLPKIAQHPFSLMANQIQNTQAVPLDQLSTNFFSQIGVTSVTPVADVVSKLQDVGDAMLAAVIYHSDHLELSEQFDGATGYEKSVKNLTWSYAAFLSAVRARTGQNVQG
jgi:hypothetical protein